MGPDPSGKGLLAPIGLDVGSKDIKKAVWDGEAPEAWAGGDEGPLEHHRSARDVKSTIELWTVPAGCTRESWR